MRTLFDKVWDSHVVADLGAGWSLLHIDRHLLHDLSGGRALTDVLARGLPVRNPALAAATPGIHAGGTVFRGDGVALPLRPSLPTSLPTDRELLVRLDERLKTLQMRA